MEFPTQQHVFYSIFAKFGPANRFRIRSGAVHHERAEGTSMWGGLTFYYTSHGLCSKVRPPPRRGENFVSFNMEKANRNRE